MLVQDVLQQRTCCLFITTGWGVEGIQQKGGKQNVPWGKNKPTNSYKWQAKATGLGHLGWQPSLKIVMSSWYIAFCLFVFSRWANKTTKLSLHCSLSFSWVFRKNHWNVVCFQRPRFIYFSIFFLYCGTVTLILFTQHKQLLAHKPWFDQTLFNHDDLCGQSQKNSVCCLSPNWDYTLGFITSFFTTVCTHSLTSDFPMVCWIAPSLSVAWPWRQCYGNNVLPAEMREGAGKLRLMCKSGFIT